MKNKRNLWLIVAIVSMIGLAFAFTACDPNNGDQNCATCGKDPCECPTSSACVHVFGDNWQLTTTASWCVDGVCGNGIETLTCTLCPATNGTRSAGLSCLGTQGLEFNDLGDEYEVGDNRNLGIVQVCIPDYHNSKPVVGISYSAIGDEGVGCEIIESIRIGANVTYIGGSAFECCTNLETVIFAEGSQLETISGWAFALTAITSITIPAGVTSIGGAAFQGCTSLETVTVLATTPPEMGWAFYQCCCDGGGILPSLTAIRVPAGSVDAYKAHPAWEEFEHLIVAIP